MFKNKTESGYEIQINSSFGKYEVIEYIGCGSFSVVYKVQDKSLHKKYSAKVISMKDMENQDFNDSVINEINILSKLNHPYIITYIESFSMKNDQNEEFFVIITEYCPNGSLRNYLDIMGYIYIY